MRTTWHCLLFLLVACVGKNNEKQTDISKMATTTIENRDIVSIKPVLIDCILSYINDTSISQHQEVIRLYSVSFYKEDNDTLFAISAHTVLPVLSPQDEEDGFEYKGYYLLKSIPILFYDHKNGFGNYFYKVGDLTITVPELHENIENRVGFSQWIYELKNGSLKLSKKTPEFRFK
jgi:hypothetical protein